MLAIVAVIVAAGPIAGWLLGRAASDPQSAPAPRVVAASPDALSSAPATAVRATPAPAPAAHASATRRLGDDELAALANDSMSGPAASRLAAIDRLAASPRDQALPLLERVLLNGEPGVDRPAALIALQTLAATQGDADGRIRDTVRKVIYHADDATLAEEAREALDRIAAAAD